jgi:CRISPR-associated exonuclease Cas4
MEEHDLVPISALEHYSYCPRQCALIHVEQVFEDNVFTERGHLAHRRVHSPATHEAGMRFGTPIWSDRLGIVGKADAVILHDGTAYPVEHKVGRARAWVHEAYQLCAQAMCLEEMLHLEIPEGAIFYRGSQVRRRVSLGREIRHRTELVIDAVRSMLRQASLPPPVFDNRCRHCSLILVCLPEAVARPRRLAQLRSELYRVSSRGAP